jgi:hypothetical protein
MAEYAVPIKASPYVFEVGLVDQSDTRKLKVNPTLAAGDFKVSIDNGAFVNLVNLPTVTPASGAIVKIVLTAAEMNGDNVVVQCIDAVGAEWCDQIIDLQTSQKGLIGSALNEGDRAQTWYKKSYDNNG